MKNKILKIAFVFVSLFLLSVLLTPQKPATAACGSLENWFCQDGSYCLSNTDKSNCGDSVVPLY